MIEYIGKCLLVDKKSLVIGDLHLGFEESMNKSGILVSRAMLNESIEYLDKVFSKTGKVKEIVLLGDIKHEFGGISNQEWGDSLRFFDYLKEKCNKIIIIKGNHDNIIGPIARRSEISVRENYICEEYCFLHGDKDFSEIYDKKIKYWIVGHAHPAIKLKEGVKIEKYKCFLDGDYKGKKIIVVPSFVEVNLGTDPREYELNLAWKFNLDKFKVKIVSDNLQVLDFGILGKLK